MPRESAGFFASNRKVTVLAAAVAALVACALWVGFLWATDTFKPAPTVQVHAENSFAETLHVVTDIDYEPFSYVDADGEYTGLDVELINEVANRLGMNLDLVLTDWSTANEMLLSGKSQVLMNMETDSAAGDGCLIATVPTTEKQYVVYGRESVSSVPELYGRHVVSLHAMPELDLDDSITYIDSYTAIFEGLKNGEYDFAICPIQVGNSFLEKLDLRDVRPSYAVGHVYGAMALTAGEEGLRDRLNLVLKELQEEGFLDQLDAKWVNHRYENSDVASLLSSRPELMAGMLALAFVLVTAVVMLFLGRRSTLAREAYTRQLQDQQAQLIEARDRAEAAGRAKTTFLFNMSHDIRTPMNAIIGYTDLAQREQDPQAMRTYLQKIDASGHQLLSLINDVLEMSRIESGKMELDLADTDLAAVADEMHDLFETQMREKGIAYTVDASGVSDRWVRCDAHHLNRVLLNLLSNALKFTPEGGSVEVRFTQVGEASEGRAPYELRVADTGIGMSAEFAERVFETFERERTSTVSGIQGTGLGMSIAKNIVDAMGGAIAVDTAPGEGTAFTVKVSFELAEAPVPADDAAAAAASGAAASSVAAMGPGLDSGAGEAGAGAGASAGADADAGAGAKSAGAEADDALDFAGMKLLLVEDNEINREIASVILEELGFDLDTAENGQEAVEKAAANRYDAVLMDIQMPVMDGYEATRAIRALPDPAAAAVPIAALTANAFAEDEKAAREAGMNGHIAKPIDVGQLVSTLRKIMAGNRRGCAKASFFRV